MGYQPRSDHRADVVLEAPDGRIDPLGVGKALGDQQIFERLDTDFRRGRVVMVVVMIGIVSVGVVVVHSKPRRYLHLPVADLLLPALVPHSYAIGLTGRSGHGFAGRLGLCVPSSAGPQLSDSAAVR